MNQETPPLTPSEVVTLTTIEKLAKVKDIPESTSFEDTKRKLRIMFPELDLPKSK